MRRKGFIYGSILMVMVNFIIHIIDFTYDVMLSKLLGAEAMGLFQMAMSLLMVILIISTMGVPTAVSRLVAEYNSKRNGPAVTNTLKVGLLLVLFPTIILSLLLILFDERIALKLFNDEYMVIGLYLLIPAVATVAVNSILRGYYYGLKMMIVPSVSQIIEHIARFMIIFTVLYRAHPIDPRQGACIAIAGITMGELFNSIWLIYMLKAKNGKIVSPFSHKVGLDSILVKILPIALPMGVAKLLNIGLRFVNSILIPQSLMKIGYSNKEAIATFGRIMGMAVPLIMLPFIVTMAMVINLVPNISENMALKNYVKVKNDIIFSIKVTLMAAIPLMGLYIAFSETLGLQLYGDLKVGRFIHIMSYGTVFIALQHTFSGILNGLKRHVAMTLNRLLGMIIQVLAIYYLVGNPLFGINGFFIGFLSGKIITFTLDILAIRKVVKLKIDHRDMILKPLLATILMLSIMHKGIKLFASLNISNTIGFALNLAIGFISYILILFITGAIPKSPLKRLIRG